MRRWTAVFFVGSSVAACNAISGAADFGVCAGTQCSEASIIEGPPADAARHVVENEPETPAVSINDASADAIADAGADILTSDSSPPCATCNAGVACCAPSICRVVAPTCGACSASGQPCGANADCCNGLVCNGAGKCAAACTAKGEDCEEDGDCCLGAHCQGPFGERCK